MAGSGRLQRFFHSKVRAAGRRYEEARQAYRDARDDVLAGDLPTDQNGRARIVCRRYADRRCRRIDAAGRPECFESDHPDCTGCREDIVTGHIETW